jgi:hypothetical protein
VAWGASTVCSAAGRRFPERQERERVSAALGFLRRQGSNDNEDDVPSTEDTGSADKTRVEGEDNVYLRRHADGKTVYLVLWTEEGKAQEQDGW